VYKDFLYQRNGAVNVALGLIRIVLINLDRFK
jgi:hypothetical protein